MRRALLCALAVASAALFGPVAQPASRAAACSILGFHRDYLDATVEETDVIAVGTLEETDVAGTIGFVVEEPLKGTELGEVLVIESQDPADCLGATQRGPADYRPGDRVLVFLVEGKGYAAYEVNRWGLDIFLVDGDVVAPYRGVNDEHFRALPRLDAVRAEFARVADEPYEPDSEARPPCNPPFLRPDETGDWARMAETIVIGTATHSDNTATVVRVDEVFRGDVGPEIRLNDHLFAQHAGGCEIQADPARRSFEPGTRLALLLVPDEFGVARWRPAVWGTAAWELNDDPEERYEGLPFLPEVRASVERVEGVTLPVAPPTAVSEALESAKPDDATAPWLFAGALFVAAVAAAAAITAILLARRAP